MSAYDREWLARELREMAVELSSEDRAELDARIAAMDRGEYEEHESIDTFMKTRFPLIRVTTQALLAIAHGNQAAADVLQVCLVYAHKSESGPV